MVGGGIKTYKRAKEEAPVLAFYQETKIRRMINITESEQIRAREYVGFRAINMNYDQFNELTTLVYERIIFF